MREFIKKILAVILAIGFCVTSVPTASIAAEPVEGPAVSETATIPEEVYSQESSTEPEGDSTDYQEPAYNGTASDAALQGDQGETASADETAVPAASSQGTTESGAPATAAQTTESVTQPAAAAQTPSTESPSQTTTMSEIIEAATEASTTQPPYEEYTTWQEAAASEENATATKTFFSYANDEIYVTAELDAEDALPETAVFVVKQIFENSSRKEDRDIYNWSDELLNKYLDKKDLASVNTFFYDMYFELNGQRLMLTKEFKINLKYKKDKVLDKDAKKENVRIYHLDDNDATGQIEAVDTGAKLEVNANGSVTTAEFKIQRYRYTPLMISMIEAKEAYEERLVEETASIAEQTGEESADGKQIIYLEEPAEEIGTTDEASGPKLITTDDSDENENTDSIGQETPEDTKVFITTEDTAAMTEGEADEETDAVESETTTEEVTTEAPTEEETSGEEVEPAEEPEKESLRSYYTSWGSDINATIILSKPAQVPDTAEVMVTPVTPDAGEYNYDAYLEALNNSDDSIIYTAENTLLYDIKFVDTITDEDGNAQQVEYEPAAGTVKVVLQFRNNQLSEEINAQEDDNVTVNHLVTDASLETADISVNDIDVQPVDAVVNLEGIDSVTFTTESFSVYAFTYTVDFEYQLEENAELITFSITGGSQFTLSYILEQLNITKDPAGRAFDMEKVTNVEFSDYDLISIERIDDDYQFTSLAPFTTTETLTIHFVDCEDLMITVKDEIKLSNDLTDFLDSATITVDGKEIYSSNWEINEGERYSINLTFQEIPEILQFNVDAGDLTYQLPSQIKVPYAQSGTLKLTHNGIPLQGNTYEVSAEGKVTLHLTEEAKTLINASSDAMLYLSITGMVTNNGGKITFKDGIEKEVDVKENHDASINKTGTYDPETGKINYTVTVNTEGSVNNVVVSDTITGQALTFDDNVQITPNPNNATAIKSGNGFTVNLGNLNSQTITIKYSASVNYGDLNGKTAVQATGNTVNLTGEGGGDPISDSSNTSHTITASSFNKYGVKSGDVFTGSDGKQYQRVEWVVNLNSEKKVDVRGTDMVDQIAAASRSCMKYDMSTPITIKRTTPNGTTQTYTVSYNDLKAHSDSSWTYTIPTSDQSNCAYEFTYYTLVEVTGLVDDISVSNQATDNGKTAGASVNVGPADSDKLYAEKQVVSTSPDSIDWKIIVNVPAAGYDSLSVTDYLPSVDGNDGKYYDVFDKIVSVDGLQSGESYEIDESQTNSTQVVINFKKSNGSDGLDASSSGQNRTLTIVVRTKNHTKWMEEATTSKWKETHTNKARVSANGVDKWTQASTSPQLKNVSKSYKGMTYVTENGKKYPVFKFQVQIEGADSQTLEIKEYYNKDLFELYTGSLDSNLKIIAGDSPYWQGTDTNQKVSINSSYAAYDVLSGTLAYKEGTTLYGYYHIDYYLKVKSDKLDSFYDDVLKNEDAKKTFNNYLTWEGDTDQAEFTYQYPGVSKESSYDTANNRATYKITINPEKLQLNSGNSMELTDTFSNISVDFSTIRFETDPAEKASEISWDYSGNTGYFRIPDSTKVVITYSARVNGTGTVRYTNEASMEGFYSSTTNDRDMTSDAGGKINTYKIRIFKYDSDKMNIGLAGAVFTLVDSEGNPQRYPSDAQNEKVGEIITFTTDETGYAEISLNESLDGLAFLAGKTYYLKETQAPEGFKTDGILYQFTISEHPNYNNYEYYPNDIMKVRNYPQEGVIKLTKTFDGLEVSTLTKEQREQITFKVVDSKGNAVTFKDASGNTVDVLTYDMFESDGTYTIAGLAEGTYTVTETNGILPGYTLQSTNYQVDSAGASTGVVTITKKDIDEKKEHTVGITNVYSSPVPANFTIKKVEFGTTTELSGARFRLQKKVNGVFVDYTNRVIGESGVITVDYKNFGTGVMIMGLEDGEYRLTEIKAPEGYKKLSSDIEFRVSGSQVAYAGNNNLVSYDSNNQVFTIGNEEKHSFTLKKVQMGNSSIKLAGAEFTVYEGNLYDPNATLPSTGFATYITDENGFLEIDFEDGHSYRKDTYYTLIETKAPAGYVLPSLEERIANRVLFYFSDGTTRPAGDYTASAINLLKKSGYAYVENEIDTTELVVGKIWQRYNLGNSSWLQTNKPEWVDSISFRLYRVARDSSGRILDEGYYPDKDYYYTIDKLENYNESTVTVRNLPQYYVNSNYETFEYDYTVVENEIEGYVAVYSDKTENGKKTGVLITNRTETTELVVNKIWDVPDGFHYSGAQVKFHVYADPVAGESTESVTVNGTTYQWTPIKKDQVLSNSNNWTMTFIGLPKDRTYHVVETAIENLSNNNMPLILGDFTVTYSNGNSYLDGGVADITNHMKDVRVKVIKKWANMDTRTPWNASFKLYRKLKDAPNAGWEDKGDRSVSLVDGEWVAEWEYLSSRYIYRVVENSVDTNQWTVIYSPEDGIVDGTEEQEITVTNIRRDDYNQKLSVQKIWVDEEGNEVTDIPSDVVITGEVYRKIVDSSNPNNVKSDTWFANFTLKDGDWSAGWTNLPSDANGEKSLFYVKESSVKESNASDYELSFANNDGVQSGTIILVNKLEDSDVTTFTVDKSWVNADGTTSWPAGKTVTMTLMDDGRAVSRPEGVSASEWINPVTLSSNQTSYTWTDLPKTGNYTVVEGNVSGYESVINTSKNQASATNYSTETIDIPVVKEWDLSGQSVPANTVVEIGLFSAEKIAGSSDDFGTSAAVTTNGQQVKLSLSQANNWTDSFADLPKYHETNGKVYEIQYSVKELSVTINGTETSDYVSSEPISYNGGFKIINTPNEGEKTGITVTKKWFNGDTEDTSRTGTVWFDVYRTTEEIAGSGINNTVSSTDANANSKTLLISKQGNVAAVTPATLQLPNVHDGDAVHIIIAPKNQNSDGSYNFNVSICDQSWNVLYSINEYWKKYSTVEVDIPITSSITGFIINGSELADYYLSIGADSSNEQAAFTREDFSSIVSNGKAQLVASNLSISSDNNWTYTSGDIFNKYTDSNETTEWTYFVVERVPSGYEDTYTISADGNITIKNTTHTNNGKLTIGKSVVKKGSAQNVSGTFRFGVFDNANASGTAVKSGSIKLDNQSSGTVTFTGMPYGTFYVFELDDKDQPITSGSGTIGNVVYTVTGSGISVTVNGSTGGSSADVTIVNEVPTGSLKITKAVQLNGVSTTDACTNGTYTFEIYKNSEKVTRSAGGMEIGALVITVTNGVADKEITVSDLEPGEYEIRETASTNTGMTLANEQRVTVTAGNTIAASATANFINNYQTKTVRATKEWTNDALPEDTSVEVTIQAMISGSTDITSEVVSSNDVTKTITGNGSVEWTDLQTYYNGEEITYSISETKVIIDGSEVWSGTGSNPYLKGTVVNGSETKFTNHYQTRTIKATKNWTNDALPDDTSVDVTIHATISGNTDVTDKVLSSEDVTRTITGDGSVEWTDLQLYYNGEEITYTVTETKVTIGGNVAWNGTGSNPYLTSTTEDGDETTFTNTYNTTTFKVLKRWMAGGSVYRPLHNGGTIWFKLVKTNGTEVVQVNEFGLPSDTVFTMSASDTYWVPDSDLGEDRTIITGLVESNQIRTKTENDTTYYLIPYYRAFENLAALENGWWYSAIEMTTGGTAELRGSTGNGEADQYWTCPDLGGFALKNNLETITAVKNWEPKSTTYIHPTITFKLYRTEVDILAGDRDGSLSRRMDAAKTNEDGEPLTYADIQKLSGYTYIADRTILSGTIDPDIEETVTWDDLPCVNLANGKRYVYVVVEDTTDIAPYEYNGTTINNNRWGFTNKLPTTTLYIKKFWKDADGKEITGNDLPDVTFKLMRVTYSNSERTEQVGDAEDVTPAGQGTLPVKEANGNVSWQRVIGNLPKAAYTEDGPVYYSYYVEEESLTGFAVTYRQEQDRNYHTIASEATANMNRDMDGLEMHNQKIKTTSVEATKKWKTGDAEKEWPDDVASVTFKLYKTVNDKESEVTASDVKDIQSEVVVTADTTDRKTTWSDLPTKYWLNASEGVEAGWYDATYTVKETAVTYTSDSEKENLTADQVAAIYGATYDAAEGTITNELYETELKILKVKEFDRTPLAGAVFTLIEVDQDGKDKTIGTGDAAVVVSQDSNPTNEEGKASFTNLKPGYYKIVEKTAPKGYNSTKEVIVIQIVVENNQIVAKQVTDDSELNMISYDQSTNTITIRNSAGSLLPSTGGMGTALFTILGALLVGTGVLLLVRSQRRRRKEN